MSYSHTSALKVEGGENIIRLRLFSVVIKGYTRCSYLVGYAMSRGGRPFLFMSLIKVFAAMFHHSQHHKKLLFIYHQRTRLRVLLYYTLYTTNKMKNDEDIKMKIVLIVDSSGTEVSEKYTI